MKCHCGAYFDGKYENECPECVITGLEFRIWFENWIQDNKGGTYDEMF